MVQPLPPLKVILAQLVLPLEDYKPQFTPQAIAQLTLPPPPVREDFKPSLTTHVLPHLPVEDFKPQLLPPKTAQPLLKTSDVSPTLQAHALK
jgi:hypothetical protein